MRRRDPEAIWNDLELRLAKSAPEGLDARVGIAFTLMVPLTLPLETAEAMLSQQGYTKILKVVEKKTARRLVVLADRFRASSVEPERATEALSTALDKGRGVCEIWLLPRDEEPVRFTAYGADLYCGDCDRHYEETSPAHFSFNSPVGACPNCNGYGRSSEYDWKRLLPDDRLSIAQGAVAVLTPTGHYRDFLALLVRRAPHAGVNPHCPWKELSEEAKRWVFEGDEDFREWKTDRRWGGVHRFFTWLEEHKYKFYVRWTIAFYRTYTTCPRSAPSRRKLRLALRAPRRGRGGASALRALSAAFDEGSPSSRTTAGVEFSRSDDDADIVSSPDHSRRPAKAEGRGGSARSS